nr:hypothetical protein [Tanacetum cinerariifolium]
MCSSPRSDLQHHHAFVIGFFYKHILKHSMMSFSLRYLYDNVCESISNPSNGEVKLLLATKPQAAHEKPPTIVTEEYIKLLFQIQQKFLVAFYKIMLVTTCTNILQLLLATKPQAAHEKPPTIVTEEYIKLLFQIQQKYYKMDPKNYDDYRGVEHAEYYFQ